MLARKIVVFVTIQLISSILGFAGFILLAHSYGDSGLGTIAFALAFTGLFQYLTKLGFNFSHLKRFSEGMDPGRSVGTYLVVKIALTMLFVLMVLAVLYLTSFGGIQLRQTPQRYVLLAILASLSFRSLAEVPAHTFAAQRRTVEQMLPSLFAAVIRLSGIVVAVLSNWNLVGVALVYLVAEIGGLSLGAWLFRGQRITWPTLGDLRHYTAFALPMLVIGLTASFELNLDKLLLGHFLGQSAVGQYFGAQRLIAFLELVASGIVFLYFPTVSQHLAAGRYDLVHRLGSKAERYSIMVFMPVVVYVWLFAGPLMAVWGKDFAQAADALRYLTIATVLTIITLPYSEQISAADRPGLRMWISVTMRVIQILLMLVLIPQQLGPWKALGLGVSGAALAKLLARVVFFASARVVCRRVTGSNSSPSILLYGGFGVISAWMIHFFVPGASGSVSPLQMLVMMPTVALSYWGILSMFRLLRGDDIRFVLGTFGGPLRQRKYLRGVMERVTGSVQGE